jgi:magnesium-transporting ATPase (P-type)
MVSAVVSIVVSMIFEADHRSTAWIEGAAILIAVFVVSTVTAYNDYKKEQQFIKLNSYSESKNNVFVLRDGEEVEVNVNYLHVGDMVQIRTGMNIPCVSNRCN